ncbi:MAG: type VI secretion system protein TssA [Desulfovibrio sp.]|jgi:type VI secretion system protein VasJ|nr:type VI secretion system protein TssA [Desulfovibrio sp.]
MIRKMGQNNSDRYWTAWSKPVVEGAPCGDDCSFSAEFEALRAEVDKEGSLYHTGGADWGLVSQLATEFLTSQSKDLWVLVYAVYAEYRINGLDSCPFTFNALSKILETYWDSLYPLPNRIQRRLAPLAWLCTRMEHCASTTCFMDGTAKSVQALQDAFIKLQNFLNEKAGEDAPLFTGIFNKIPKSTLEIPEPAEQPPNPIPHTPLAASLAEMDKDGRIPSGILPQLIRNVIEQNKQLAGHFLSLDVRDERAYQLHRVALWSTLIQAPQADSDGKTQLSNGVPADRIHAYTAAVEGKRYAEALPQLEISASKSPFWFDGHVMTVRCLEGLGARTAANVVRENLAALLQRFPELLSYKFKDSTPFASPKTLPWLESISTQSSSGDTASNMAVKASTPEGKDEETRLQEAIACSANEGFQAGLRRLGTVPVGRSRIAVLHGIMQARYCLATGKKSAATRLLLALYQQMERWDLLDWEPELTARVLALLFASQPKQRGDSAEDMIRRLHWLNLDTALGIFQDV